ncbi:hypothetical protein EXIGLDRAFT_745491 [Exidia glandulosa HHB12029]|uniref:K Homology domain-containing protein n=1 Tax=Exidia glandulosa HHB12029 TaxID=1314781 RepID=A0A165NFH9_EXIGL|nr:hypothetical protein EXIGLDRAFT_745491 [Exidia glandulosa HHB12029]
MSQSPKEGSPARSPSPQAENSHDTLTLRALVTTKDAGVIIGKAGKNVADIRDHTGVKAGVSKVVPGVHERVLTITGSVEGVAKAYTLIITQLLSASTTSPTISSPPPSQTALRLLISHNLMGSVIGRNGLKIKAIQDASGARMVASKDMLPQSTERIVEVQGTAEAIGRAIEEIGKCLLEDWERGQGTVLFHPGHGIDSSTSRRSPSAGTTFTGGSPSGFMTSPGRRSNGPADLAAAFTSPRTQGGGSPVPSSPQSGANGANLRTQNISIPSDMVGCIIGRQGTKITEIRRLSGSKISIAKTPHDETGERMFTIVGTPEANEKALFLFLPVPKVAFYYSRASTDVDQAKEPGPRNRRRVWYRDRAHTPQRDMSLVRDCVQGQSVTFGLELAHESCVETPAVTCRSDSWLSIVKSPGAINVVRALICYAEAVGAHWQSAPGFLQRMERMIWLILMGETARRTLNEQ